MKPFSTLFLLVLGILIVLPQTAHAQLQADQRVLDFQNLAALYAKRYAPYDWKKQALGFDLLNLQPWIDRVRNAKDDLEFFEIEGEYVGKFQDTHSGFLMTSSFSASLNMTVDIYDGKVLIDTINRASLPVATYPFQIGDELVSVDGVSSEEWITRLSVWRQYGNPASTRRLSAGKITVRRQSDFPRAAEIGDSASVEIRRASGVVERYTIPWSKTGLAVTTVGPVPVARALATPETPDELHNYKLPDNDMILTPVPWAKDADGVARTFVNGIGSRAPLFAAGFPSGFVQRLGRVSTDFHYSGTYVSNGLTIGYLRIPSFSQPSTALTELRAEIDFLQKNTDGLIVDVMRNPGGGCYMLDVAATLIPYPFYFFGEQVRATQDRLNSYQSQLDSLRIIQALPGNPAGVTSQVINAWQVYVDELKAALNATRGMTDPIAACQQSGTSSFTTAPVMNDNVPGPVVYTKPFIVLIDEFSISAADIFPSMIQDNGRALLVGARTSGGGGSVSGWPTGFYSESQGTNTNTLVVRKRAIVTSDYPTAPFVENIGARPDIPLNYMTKDNLLNGGRTFVNQFTQVLVDQIRKEPGPTPYSIPDSGSFSQATSGISPQTLTGYARIQPNSGSTAPNGLALIGFRQGNVLVSETGVPAVSLIQSGRILAESAGSVNTGIALANPNGQPSTIQFYFTGANGNFGNGSFDIPANGQIANFLDQAPFNAVKPLNGTFTFSASTPVAALALRSFTNERGESLFTTLPVSEVGTAANGAVTFPHFADGGGWTSQVNLVNTTDSAMSGTVQFFDAAGAAVTLTVDGQTGTTFNYAIPPRGSQKLRTSGSAGSTAIGSVRVAPVANTSSPTGLVLFSFRANGVTVTEAGVPAPSTGNVFRVYAEASGDFGRGLIGSIQTGVAISNPSNVSTTVFLELKRLDGSATGLTASIVVPANGQVAKFLYQIPGLTGVQLPFQGVLRISSPTPVSVIALRHRINERQNSLITTIPAVNESSAGANGELVFPHLADGGGYITQFVLFSGTAGTTLGGSSAPLTGALRLVTPSGSLLNLPLH
jgi:hypothetical protein